MRIWPSLAVALSSFTTGSFIGCSERAQPVDSAPAPEASNDAGSGSSPVTVAPPPATTSYTVDCGASSRYWPEEQDSVTWKVGCTGNVVATGLPDGATFDATTNVVAWTPRLDQAGSFSIHLTDASGGETRIEGNVLDRFDAPGNAPLTSPSTYTDEFGIPVFHLTWHSDIATYCEDAVDRDAVPADIVVNGVAHPGAELRCRGATSLAYPKKSFSLRFTSDNSFQAPSSVSAFQGRRRLVLTTSFDDNSQVRNRMSFALWNLLDPEHIRVDQASAVVFIDGVYQGLYQLTDDVEDHLMKVRGLDDDGQIFKADTNDANYRTTLNSGAAKSDLTVGYEKSDGDPATDFTDLLNLLHWSSDSTLETIESSIDTTLDTDDFLDWYILATTIVGFDNYAKNSIIYRDDDGPDPRIRYIPWDLNGTLGQGWNTARIVPTAAPKTDTTPAQVNGIWQRISESSTLTARLNTRFAAALAGPINVTDTLALFDAMMGEIRLAALRDDRKWDAARRAYPTWSSRTDFTTFDSERTYLRSWIQQRWAFQLSQYSQ